MTTDTEAAPQTRPFEADVAKLLHLMVHSVYSDKDVFLRELVSNAADACEKLRYEGVSHPELLGDDPHPRVTITLEPDARRLTVEDNGIGMTVDELADALGTIARSGTKAFVERIAGAGAQDGAQLIGQFGVGFYSAFLVADKVTVESKNNDDEMHIWESSAGGSFTVRAVGADYGRPIKRGTRLTLHEGRPEGVPGGTFCG